MSEIMGQHEPKPIDPELLPCQEEMRQLCDEILALKPDEVRLTFWDVMAQADPTDVQQRLRNGRQVDLMLKDGDTLSVNPPSKYHSNLNLFVGQAQLTGVSVRAWGWEYDKRRIGPNGPDKSPYDVIEYPGEKDWSRQLDISLLYSNGQRKAAQTVTMQTGSMQAGELPSISRHVFAPAYAETGYGGHNREHRDCVDQAEVSEFIALARELYESRPTEAPAHPS